VSTHQPSTAVLDLRTYRLVPGGGEEFDRLFRERALPMLQRYRIDVVGYGPSLDDGDVYYLVRAFPSAAVRDEELGAFYGGAEWRDNLRESVLALIESHHTLLLELTQLSRGGSTDPESAPRFWRTLASPT
jgi:hypothetical protein